MNKINIKKYILLIIIILILIIGITIFKTKQKGNNQQEIINLDELANVSYISDKTSNELIENIKDLPILIQKDNLYYFIDGNGQELSSIGYKYVQEFCGKYTICQKDITLTKEQMMKYYSIDNDEEYDLYNFEEKDFEKTISVVIDSNINEVANSIDDNILDFEYLDELNMYVAGSKLYDSNFEIVNIGYVFDEDYDTLKYLGNGYFAIYNCYSNDLDNKDNGVKIIDSKGKLIKELNDENFKIESITPCGNYVIFSNDNGENKVYCLNNFKYVDLKTKDSIEIKNDTNYALITYKDNQEYKANKVLIFKNNEIKYEYEIDDTQTSNLDKVLAFKIKDKEEYYILDNQKLNLIPISKNDYESQTVMQMKFNNVYLNEIYPNLKQNSDENFIIEHIYSYKNEYDFYSLNSNTKSILYEKEKNKELYQVPLILSYGERPFVFCSDEEQDKIKVIYIPTNKTYELDKGELKNKYVKIGQNYIKIYDLEGNVQIYNCELKKIFEYSENFVNT